MATDESIASATRQLRGLSRRLIRELGLLERPAGVCSIGDCHLLLEIARNAGISAAQLSHELLLDKSTISRKLARLERRGWVAGRADPADRRSRRLRLSAEGRRQLAQVERAAERRVATALGSLGADERTSVTRGFGLYVDALARARLRGPAGVRPIRRRDDPAIATVIRNVMDEFDLAGADTGSPGAEIDRMFDSYRHDGAAYFVATLGANVVGGAGIGPLPGAPADVCELRRMYLLGAARGRGLGRQLLEHCLAAARTAQYQRCYLETAPPLADAQRLYRRYGFRRRRTRLGQTGHTACQIYYQLRL